MCPDGSLDLMIGCAFRTDYLSRDQWIMGLMHDSFPALYHGGIYGKGFTGLPPKLTITARQTALGSGTYEATCSADITDNDWHYVAACFSFTGSLRVYLDGGNSGNNSSGGRLSTRSYHLYYGYDAGAGVALSMYGDLAESWMIHSANALSAFEASDIAAYWATGRRGPIMMGIDHVPELYLPFDYANDSDRIGRRNFTRVGPPTTSLHPPTIMVPMWDAPLLKAAPAGPVTGIDQQPGVAFSPTIMVG